MNALSARSAAVVDPAPLPQPVPASRPDRAATLLAQEAAYGAHNYHPLPVVLSHGEGVWVWDVEGRRYLDMMSAYSAVSQGHRHPRIVAAAHAQIDRLGVVSRAVHSDQLAPFVEALVRLTGLDRALVMNSGAEAVETAIKAARRWATRHRGVADGAAEIIVAEGNFHGRTTTIVGFSSDPDYRRGFGPYGGGFRTVPFGDAQAVRAAITPTTAAILIEPIQGEAGIRVPPDSYLPALRQIADQAGILLILDEVQSGLGRSGRMFCFQHAPGVMPDGLILGKALGGGLLPVSAFVARQQVMDVFGPGSHGSTFGGYPLAAAVGRAALEVIVDEDLAGRSARLGEVMRQRLAAIAHPAIREVRGRGLWIGVELDPARVSARSVCEAMMAEGILVKETHQTVVRFAPPLVIDEAEVAFATDAFARVLANA